jgi:hypothetical protein
LTTGGGKIDFRHSLLAVVGVIQTLSSLALVLDAIPAPGKKAFTPEGLSRIYAEAE